MSSRRFCSHVYAAISDNLDADAQDEFDTLLAGGTGRDEDDMLTLVAMIGGEIG